MSCSCETQGSALVELVSLDTRRRRMGFPPWLGSMYVWGRVPS